MYVVLDKAGKQPAALYGTPGKEVHTVCGTGPIRGEFASTNGRAFTVSGLGLYEVLSNGTNTLRGTLNSFSINGICTFDENGPELAICDGDKIYIFTYATNNFGVVTDPDLPSVGSVTFLGGYFIANKNASQAYYVSDLYSGTSWQPLQFASAESSPDNLSRVIRVSGQVFGLGTNTTEIFTQSGATFPFQKISGAQFDVGILAPYSAVPVDNSLYWIGQDSNGSGIVYRNSGYTPIRVSTEAMELIIAQATDPTKIRGHTYQEDGHTFVMFTGGGLPTSICFDISTKYWHKRAYLNGSGFFEPDLANSHMFAFGKHLVGSRLNGAIYNQSMNNYTDAGSPLCRERTYTHISEENQRIRFDNLVVGFETGVGTQTGQGFDPTCMLSVSRNEGHSFTQWQTATIGAVGRYRTRVIFWRLGTARTMTFRLRVTDPIPVRIVGSWVNVPGAVA